jgi:hypothetical protein
MKENRGNKTKPTKKPPTVLKVLEVVASAIISPTSIKLKLASCSAHFPNSFNLSSSDSFSTAAFLTSFSRELYSVMTANFSANFLLSFQFSFNLPNLSVKFNSFFVIITG